ncbi:hypothetical protein BO78DRAFT_389661 [Aspergillus sclerotiicarbonarius CBS 121057]|uniref:Uncharacterized protein n=1 Tax=Aspergillus sclerotiicarbonarius (strain CBS 121057 / IBT 28362) TaxID=1448318 RepID=A0A319DZC8_ASPSB|nr:hypothetical protein BO78DRAFT_389661 [Aspergillus sclerotiicarbonarius CBS 121057]
MTLDILKTPAHIFALIVSLILGDMGKDPELPHEVTMQEFKNLEADVDAIDDLDTANRRLNHDELLDKAISLGMFSRCLNYMAEPLRSNVLLGMKLGAQLNIPQLFQGENAPGSLKGLSMLSGNPQAYALKYLETLFDAAGASGNVDARGSISMTQPLCESYLLGYPILERAIEEAPTTGDICFRKAYDAVLLNRAQLLIDQGVQSQLFHNRSI